MKPRNGAIVKVIAGLGMGDIALDDGETLTFVAESLGSLRPSIGTRVTVLEVEAGVGMAIAFLVGQEREGNAHRETMDDRNRLRVFEHRQPEGHGAVPYPNRYGTCFTCSRYSSPRASLVASRR